MVGISEATRLELSLKYKSLFSDNYSRFFTYSTDLANVKELYLGAVVPNTLVMVLFVMILFSMIFFIFNISCTCCEKKDEINQGKCKILTGFLMFFTLGKGFVNSRILRIICTSCV